MKNIEEIKKLRDEEFKDMFLLGEIVETLDGEYGFICDFGNGLIRINTGNEVRFYNKVNLKKVKEGSKYNKRDLVFNTGDIVGIECDFSMSIGGITKKVKRGACGVITEKFKKVAELQLYIGNEPTFIQIPYVCLTPLSNVPAQLITTDNSNSNSYSSPLAEMLEKEKEEERNRKNDLLPRKHVIQA